MKQISKIRAYIYLRYSSHNQDCGYSIEGQRAALEKYAQANNIEIIAEFVDEAKTGRNTNRLGYQSLMNELEKGNIKLLMVHKLDRFHRDTENQLRDLKRLTNLGIRFIAVADGIDTDEPSANLIAVIKAALAEQFSINLSHETRKGQTEAAKLCLHCGGKPPYGFKLDADRHLATDETTAPAIRQIFKMYLADMGYTTIIEWLKKHGFRTAKGNNFTKPAINSILHNEKYAGVYVYDKTAPKDENGRRNSHKYKDTYVRIEGGCPAIISPEDFERVQRKMRERSGEHNHHSSCHYYALNGKLWNIDETARYSGNINHSNGKKYYQYRCTQKGCKSVSANTVEEAVFFALKSILLSPDKEVQLLEALNRYDSDLHSENRQEYLLLKQKRAAYENRLANLVALGETNKAPVSILDRITALETEIANIDSQTELFNTAPHTFTSDDLKAVRDNFITYMSQHKTLEAKNLIDRTIDKILIGDEIIEIKFKNGVTATDQTAKFFRK